MTHLYILYLVEKPWRFFSTKSMYSGEWWKGPLSDRSQSRGPPGLSLGRLTVATAAAVTPDRKHTQQWRLRLTTPHRAIRDGGSEGGMWSVVVVVVVVETGVQQTKPLITCLLLHWYDRGTCITSTSPKPLKKNKRVVTHTNKYTNVDTYFNQ